MTVSLSPLPSYVKLQLFNGQFRKNRPSAIVSASSSNNKTLLDIPKLLPLNNHNYTTADTLRVFSTKQTVIEDLGRELRFSGRRSGEEDEESEEAMRSLIQRLETAVEGIVELELEKFKGKVREDLSDEEIAVVKKMSREIASRFLERPANYLRRKNINPEEKMKEMNFLLSAFQNSCSLKSRTGIHSQVI